MESVKSLVSLEFRTLPRGYKFLSRLKSDDFPSFLEIIPLPPGKLACLIGGDFKSLEKIWQIVKKNKKDISDSCFLSACPSDLLPCLYGQKKPEVLDFVCVVQTKSLSKSLVLSELLIKTSKVKLLEIDNGRALGGQSVFYFTALKSELKAVERTLKSKRVEYAILPKESSITGRYFQSE